MRRARPTPGHLIDADSDVDGLLDHGIAVPTKTDATQLQSGDYSITIGWDCLGANEVVMPSEGKVEGREDTVDFCQNDRPHWTDVLAEVRRYSLGGYQVSKSGCRIGSRRC